MSINEKQNEIIEEFNQFDDWMDKYSLLIDLGNSLQAVEENNKVPQNIIEGCQSRVWLVADFIDGKVIYRAESEAILVKGIVSLLIQVLSDHTPDEILNTDLYFIEKGKGVLIDYKTDYLDVENERAKVEDYSKQLLLYKEALEKIKAVAVEEAYLYFSRKEKFIKVELGGLYD